ncbi:MAG: Beta-lactamase class C-like and penicillin binding proteins (PBPs) superfamily, partial [uncultured Gemmatimonadetes bacterium]
DPKAPPLHRGPGRLPRRRPCARHARRARRAAGDGGARPHAQPRPAPRPGNRGGGADGEEPRGARVVSQRRHRGGQPRAGAEGGGVRQGDLGRGRAPGERRLHPVRPGLPHQGGGDHGGHHGAGGGRPPHAGRPGAQVGAAVLRWQQGQRDGAPPPHAHGRGARGGQRHRQRGAGRRAALPDHPPAGHEARQGRPVLGHRLRDPVDRGAARGGRAAAALPEAPRVGPAGDGLHADGRGNAVRPLRAHAAARESGGALHGRLVRRGGAAHGRGGGERGGVQHGARPLPLRRDDRQRGAAGERARLPEAHRARLHPPAARRGDAGAGVGGVLPRGQGARPRDVRRGVRLRPLGRHRHLHLDRPGGAELGGAPHQPHLPPQGGGRGHAGVPAARVPRAGTQRV